MRDYTLVNPGVAWTAGGMVSTLGDLRTWGRALARGTLLSKRLHARQLRFGPIPNPGSPIKIGYGLGVFKLGRWIGHNGAIYGFSTITMYLPGSGAQFVATANRPAALSRLDLTDVLPAPSAHRHPSHRDEAQVECGPPSASKETRDAHERDGRPADVRRHAIGGLASAGTVDDRELAVM